MGERRICSDCHTQSPETETAYTLIDAHGWRNTRHKDAAGRYVVEWRCGACWHAYKEATNRLSATMPVASSQPASRDDDPSAPFVRAAQRLATPSSDQGGGKRS
jgi:hypothetical protein